MTHFELFETGAETNSPTAGRFYTRFGKRMLDLGISLALLPLLLPVIAALWGATRMNGGTGFFAHTRIGQSGLPFRCFKIRTMYQNADQILQDHLASNPDATAEWTRTRKLKNDPRITPLGGFLRRTSLDELPQILNVLRGNMSLVGPRPITAEELSYYDPTPSTYLAQKPGITGPWQVHGRQNGCYQARVTLDRTYLSKASLLTDIDLIARTAVTVIRPSGS